LANQKPHGANNAFAPERDALTLPPAKPSGQNHAFTVDESAPTANSGKQTPNPSENESPDRFFDCDAVDFLEDPRSALSTDEIAQQTLDRFEQLPVVLAASSDLQHRLAATLFKIHDDQPVALDDLLRLKTVMPKHPVLHWRLLDACRLAAAHSYCASGQYEVDAIGVLGDNAEAWGKIAYHRSLSNDDAGALKAIENAASATIVDDFWGTETHLLFQSLSAAGNGGVAERLFEAMRYAAMISLSHAGLIGLCETKAATSPNWARACTDFGRRREQGSRTAMGRALGAALQKAMHKQAGLDDKASAAALREERLATARFDPRWPDLQVLLFHEEHIALDYLQQLTIHGEFAARDFLHKELERVQAIPGYDPCP